MDSTFEDRDGESGELPWDDVRSMVMFLLLSSLLFVCLHLKSVNYGWCYLMLVMVG